jgi:hypothetical protein
MFLICGESIPDDDFAILEICTVKINSGFHHALFYLGGRHNVSFVGRPVCTKNFSLVSFQHSSRFYG